VSLLAQDPTTFLRGEVTGASPADRLFVEVYEQQRKSMIDRVPIYGDGRFEVTGVHTGEQYELRVVKQNGEKIQSEDITLNSPSMPVNIQLQVRIAVSKPNDGPVSLYRLRHQVPAKAMNEFRKAESDWRSGNYKESIARLEKALTLDPGYMEAHNNLGTKLLASGDVQRASEEFRKSIALDPNSAPGHLNLAVTLLINPKDKMEAREAEEHARKALQMDPSSLSARYTLGIALSFLNSDEALPYLRASAETYPRARLAAANLLERLGRKQEANAWREEIKTASSGR